MGRKGCWHDGHIIAEQYGFSSQLVKVRCADPGIAIASKVVRACCIKRNNYYVLCNMPLCALQRNTDDYYTQYTENIITTAHLFSCRAQGSYDGWYSVFALPGIHHCFGYERDKGMPLL